MNPNPILSKFESLLKVGKHEKANNLLFNYLISNPNDHEVRSRYRSYSVLSNEAKSVNFATDFKALYSETLKACISAAISGWQYTRVIDKSFIDPYLEIDARISAKEILKSKLSSEHLVKNFNYPNSKQFFEKLKRNNSLQDRWNLTQRFIDSKDSSLLVDDFKLVPFQDLNSELAGSLNGSHLNIIILGAGCVGLALANVLKMGLGNRINILVIENRVSEIHVKKPYTRSWLTNIPTDLFTGVYDPNVTQILDEFGVKNYLGGKLNLIETLLLTSCRNLNVKFLFSEFYDLSFVEKSKTNVIFDATGGQFNQDTQISESFDPVADIVLPEIQGLGEWHDRHGIINRDIGERQNIQLIEDGNLYYPVINGVKMVTSILKISSIPISLYNDLINYITKVNHDSIFYAWPGKLVPELNEILLLINLDKQNLNKLSILIPQKIKLNRLMDNAYIRSSEIDSRIIGLFDLILKISKERDSIIVEPPFLHKPYVYLFPDGFSHIYGRPIIPVGDSVFIGNPKVGNGLENHFKFIRKIHDIFLFVYNKK